MSDISKLTEKTIAGLKVEKVSQKQKHRNILIYGDSGIGKTVLAGSADEVAELTPIIFLDIEGGTMSIGEAYPNIDTVRITNWQELQNVYEYLYDNPTLYKTVVVDSLSEAQKYSMIHIMERLAMKGRKSGEVDEDVTPSEREWGINLEQTRTLVRAFRDLPMNVIFTSHALEDRDKKTGAVKIKPSLTGKSKNELPGFLDIVLYFYMIEKDNKQVRVLLTTSTDKVAAKDRTRKLPMFVENPTMKMLYDIINGDKK